MLVKEDSCISITLFYWVEKNVFTEIKHCLLVVWVASQQARLVIIILLEKEMDGISKVKVMVGVVQKEQVYQDIQKECELLWNCKIEHVA